MSVVGYWLSIEGFPYYFGTKDLSTPSTFNPDNDKPWLAGSFSGRLNWPTGTIDEQIEPVTGAMRASSMTFTLVDDPAQPVLDQYFTTDPRRVTTATIAASISDTDTDILLNATVPSSITGLSYPTYLWIDDECVYADNYAANTLTSCTRGVYGTRASAHRVDTELGQYPEVWPKFPAGIGRRVILWAVDDSDLTTAEAVWRGYLRSPRLAQNGAAFELACEHLSTWEMQRPAGGLTYSTRLRGYSSRAIQFKFYEPNAYGGLDGYQWVGTYHPDYEHEGWFTRSSLDDFLRTSRDTLTERLLGTSLNGSPAKTAQTKVSVRIDRVGQVVQFGVTASDTGGGTISAAEVVTPAVAVSIFGQETSVNAMSRGASWDYSYRGNMTVQFPTCALAVRSDIARAVPVERLDGLPTTFDGPTVYSDGPFSTRIHAVLTAPYDDSARLLLIPRSSTTNDTTIGGGPSITCVGKYIPMRGSSVGSASVLQKKIIVWLGTSNETGHSLHRDTGSTLAYIPTALKLSYSQWVTTDHWVYGIKRALADSGVSTGSDSRNWDWSTASTVANVTAGDLSSREWFLDGGKSLKDLLGDTLALDGCALSTGRYGRLRIIPVQPGRQHWGTNDVAAEIDCKPPAVSTRVPLVAKSMPQWGVLAEALTNVVSLSLPDAGKVIVRDVRSFQRWGQRANLDLQVEGLPLDRQAGEDPRAVQQRLLARIMGLWSEPVFQAVVSIPASNRSGEPLWYGASAIYTGSHVMLRNGFNIPTGDGTRGFDLRSVFVAGRRVNLAQNTIDLTLWLLPASWCYTPCVKAASIVAATGVVTAATGYVKRRHADATDYAGGLLGTGGVSGFAAGDKVRLITRDSASPSQETYTVASVNSIAGTITMTTAIATAPYNWPTLASNGWVDVIDATFTTTPNNSYYAWVGDGNAAEGVIGAGTTQTREFAP